MHLVIRTRGPQATRNMHSPFISALTRHAELKGAREPAHITEAPQA